MLRNAPVIEAKLLAAALNEDWEQVLSYLNQFPNISIIDAQQGRHKGKSALWVAANAGKWDIVMRIVEAHVHQPTYLKQILNAKPTPELNFIPNAGITFQKLQAYSHSVFSAEGKSILGFALSNQLWEIAAFLVEWGAALGARETLKDDVCNAFVLRTMKEILAFAKVIGLLQQRITKLSLQTSDLSNYRIRSILKTLLQHPIVDLDLSYCRLNNDGALELAKFLKQNSTLKRLNLSGNSIGSYGVIGLCEALIENNTLQALSLSANLISFEGAQAIAQMLLVNTSLIEVWLFCNEIGEKGGAVIREALHKNKSIYYLHVSSSQVGSENVVGIYNAALINEDESKALYRNIR